MVYTIRTVFESGRIEKFTIWATTLSNANDAFFDHCNGEEGGTVVKMELKQGRTRLAFQRFENGRML